MCSQQLQWTPVHCLYYTVCHTEQGRIIYRHVCSWFSHIHSDKSAYIAWTLNWIMLIFSLFFSVWVAENQIVTTVEVLGVMSPGCSDRSGFCMVSRGSHINHISYLCIWPNICQTLDIYWPLTYLKRHFTHWWETLARDPGLMEPLLNLLCLSAHQLSLTFLSPIHPGVLAEDRPHIKP